MVCSPRLVELLTKEETQIMNKFYYLRIKPILGVMTHTTYCSKKTFLKIKITPDGRKNEDILSIFKYIFEYFPIYQYYFKFEQMGNFSLDMKLRQLKALSIM